MLRFLREGLDAVRKNWGLAVLLLTVNLGVAAMLAIPLQRTLERDLEHKDAAANMMYGFDYSWWSRWSDAQTGWAKAFGPDILGSGFAFKNLDLLLKGQLPAATLKKRGKDGEGEETAERVDGVDGVILALGGFYLLLQTFLAGGILGVLRSPTGGWTLRGLFHGSGFYFGRFLRLGLLVLLADYVLFRIHAPLAGWADGQATEAVAETTALAWSFGKYGTLLLGLLAVHLVSCYAKVIVVLEERSSAILALVSAASFCVSRFVRVAGHYLAIAAMAVLLLVAWTALDARWTVVGYKTQAVALLLSQAFVFLRIGLRLGLLGGQVAIYRAARGDSAAR